jgi:hypothetical protein
MTPDPVVIVIYGPYFEDTDMAPCMVEVIKGKKLTHCRRKSKYIVRYPNGRNVYRCERHNNMLTDNPPAGFVYEWRNAE